MLDRHTNAGYCLDYAEPSWYYKQYGKNLETLRKESIKMQDDLVTQKKAECSAGKNAYLAHAGYGNHPVFGKQLAANGVWSLVSGKKYREGVRRARIDANYQAGKRRGGPR